MIGAPPPIPAAQVFPAASAAPTAAGASDEIVVTGSKRGTLDLDRLRRAEAVFVAGRAQFAPRAVLYFRIPPAEAATIRLTLRNIDGGAGDDVDVPVDGEGRFTLPARRPGNWELAHNLGSRPMRVRVRVLAPGDSVANLSLGDLRLACRVGWELGKDSYSFVARGAFAALGGCDGSKLAIFFTVPRPISAVDLSSGTRHLALPLRSGATAFHPPLSDHAWPNEARIHVTYRAGDAVVPGDGIEPPTP